jgi:CDP-diacylglycerol---glycerol-3-phosphate 3-phosphatidyltransferase
MLSPNLLTIGRAVLGPVFLALFIVRTPLTDILCLVLALAIESSDVLDGYLARRQNCVTKLGKVLDPFADSVSRFSVFLAFYVGFHADGLCPLWVVAVLFYRDSLVVNLRMFAAIRNVVVSARLTGKIKAVIQGAAALAVLVLLVAAGCPAHPTGWLAAFIYWSLTVVGVVTAASGLDYTIGIARQLAGQPDPAEPGSSSSA